VVAIIRKRIRSSKYGRWKILGPSRTSLVKRQGYVLCRCNCGTQKDIYRLTLEKGLSTSCGCRKHERTYTADGKKRCPACKTFHPLSAFGRRLDRGREEVRPKCKQCSNAARGKRRSEMTAEEKKQALVLARAWKRNNRKRNRTTKYAWEARNPEKVSEYSRKTSQRWRAANRRLAIERSLESRAKKPEQYKAYHKRGSSWI
jgi:hypothetical protein